MMENFQWLIWLLLGLNVVAVVLLLRRSESKGSAMSNELVQSSLNRIESTLKEETRVNRDELSKQMKDNRQELNDSLRVFSEQNQR
jgi:hypothetical protein